MIVVCIFVLLLSVFAFHSSPKLIRILDPSMISGRVSTHTAYCLFHLKALLLLINRNATGTKVDKEQEPSDNGESLEKIVLEEVTVRVETMRTINMRIVRQIKKTDKYE